MKRIKWLVGDYPAVDLVLAVSAAALLATRASDHLLGAADQDQRTLIYAAVLAAATTLLGLVSASLAIIKGLGDGPRIRVVRDRMGSKVTDQMGAAMKGLGLSAALALVALLADTSVAAPNWMLLIAYCSILVGAARLSRAVWITLLVLRLDDADTSYRPRAAQAIKRRDRAA